MDAVRLSDLEVDSPAALSLCSYSARVKAPAKQPVEASMSVRVAASMSGAAGTDES